MRRWFFNILSALSLLLFVATIGMWAFSYRRPCPRLSWGNSSNSTGHSVAIVRGSISYQMWWGVRPVPAKPHPIVQQSSTSGWDAWGFHYHRGVTNRLTLDNKPLPGTFGNWTEFWFELYWPLLITAPLSFYCVVRLALNSTRAKQRAARGLCPTCGYDLRATPDRCPECGTPAPQKAQP